MRFSFYLNKLHSQFDTKHRGYRFSGPFRNVKSSMSLAELQPTLQQLKQFQVSKVQQVSEEHQQEREERSRPGLQLNGNLLDSSAACCNFGPVDGSLSLTRLESSLTVFIR